MTRELLLVVGVLFAIDLALRPWRPFKTNAGHNLAYTLLAYVPLVVIPHLSAFWITIAAAVIGIGSLISYGRMVGLTQYPRFFVPAAIATAAFYAAARAHWYGLFQAMPVFGLMFVIAVAVFERNAEAFLQKLCLAWLGLLIYGYLWAHAALFTDPEMLDHAEGALLLAVVILLAKFADVAWVAVHRVLPQRKWPQLVVSPLAGMLGGVLVAASASSLDLTASDGGPSFRILMLLGAIVGGALAFASRSYDLIVNDVLGPAAAELRKPLKGTMLFGFAFSLALAFHWLRYRA